MTEKSQILIVDDELEFLERTKRNIKKFCVVTTSTIPDAIQIIRNGGISLIVVDIKLKGSSRGFKIFNELFFRGISIPGILITGHAFTNTDKRYFASRGAIRILNKGVGKGPLSARIEQEAVKILAEENSPFILYERRITQDSLGYKNMMYGGDTKKISDWLDVVKTPETPPEEKTAILRNIAEACKKYSQHQNDADYTFP